MRGLGKYVGKGRRRGGVIFDYYIDSDNGSDSNNGKYASSAFATFANIPTDKAYKIGIASNSVIRGQLNLNYDGFFVDSYGTGTKPKILATDIITGWTKTSGYTNIYQKAITIDNTSTSASIFVRAFVDGARLQYKTSLANLDIGIGYYYAGTYPNYTVYVNNAEDISVSTKQYEVTTRLHCIVSNNNNNHNIRNIDCYYNAHMDGSIVLRGTGLNLYNLGAYEGSKHNILTGAGIFDNIVAKYAQYFVGSTNTSKSLYVNYLTAAAGQTVTYKNCTAEWTLTEVLAENNCTAFLQHTDGISRFGDTTLDNCTVKYCSNAFNVGMCDNVYIVNPITTDCKGFCAASGNNIYINQGIADYSNIAAAQLFSSIASNSKIYIRGNFYSKFKSANAGMFYLQGAKDGIVIDIDGMITDPSAAAGTIRCFECESGITNTLIKVRNMYFNGLTYVFRTYNTGVTIDSDYNYIAALAYHGSTVNNVSYSNFTNYRNGTGQDAHTLVANLP